MSDKDFDLDEILGERKKKELDDISFKKEDKKSSDIDEIDELLASLKKPKRAEKVIEEPEEISEYEEDEDDFEDEEYEEPAPKKSADLDEEEDEYVDDEEDIAVIPAKTKKSKPAPKAKAKPRKVIEDDDGYVDDDEEEDEPVKKKQPNRSSSAKKKKRRSRIGFNGSIFGGIILITIILTVSMLLAVGGLTIGMEFYGIGKSENDISFNIPEDSSNEEIADLLVQNGIIKRPDLFLAAMRFMKPENIYPGDITLKPAMPYTEIIETMAIQRKTYETVTITFTEGEYLTDIAAKLEENNVCTADDFLFQFNRNSDNKFEKYLTNNHTAFYAREGYFFPDTYEFYVGVEDNAFNITKTIKDHFDSKISDEMYVKMNAMGLDLNQTITLASIVQMEAANTKEMPHVASVFLNRMKDADKFPRLESNTTDKYIEQVIKVNAGSDDSIKHYTELYDTYKIDGLPAGPICNPGLDAIEAVLNPTESNDYYFCNNLETGETFYAETLEEHENNQIKAGLKEAVVEEEPEEEEEEEEEEEDYEEYYDDYYEYY